MNRDYIIGTGYYEDSEKDMEFYQKYWLPNTLKYSSPQKIVVVNSGSPNRKVSDLENWIDLTTNPGPHANAPRDQNLLGGWNLGFIQGALYAYSCRCDFIYKEQDCLAFGNWITESQEALETQKKLALVGKLKNWPDFPGSQGDFELCLVYLKFEHIINFLNELFSIPLGDMSCFCEKKFNMIGEKTNSIGEFGFGYGGNRPFVGTDPTFYIQKPRWWGKVNYVPASHLGGKGIPQEELDILIKTGLLDE